MRTEMPSPAFQVMLVHPVCLEEEDTDYLHVSNTFVFSMMLLIALSPLTKWSPVAPGIPITVIH